MPSSSLDFRPICGCFFGVYRDFMLKRQKKAAAMFVFVKKLKNRAGGVTCGLLLTLLIWGELLMQSGDIESNPGPKANLRQTRLSSTLNQEPPGTIKDVLSTLATMNTKFEGRFDAMDANMKGLYDSIAGLKEETKGLRDEVADLRARNKELSNENHNLEKRLTEVERKTDNLECRSKRNNLIVHGLRRREGETAEDCQAILRELLVDQLECCEEAKFDRVHRLSAKPDSPMIARCTFFQDKVDILKAKSKLKGTDVFIGEDFSVRARDIRRKLIPHMQKARIDGKNVKLVFDHLIIDGEKFTIDGDDQNLKELR